MTAAEERAQLDLLRRVIATGVSFEEIEEFITDVRDGRPATLRGIKAVA